MAKVTIDSDEYLAASVAAWYKLFADDLFYETRQWFFDGGMTQLVFYKIRNGKVDLSHSIMDIVISNYLYDRFFKEDQNGRRDSGDS